MQGVVKSYDPGSGDGLIIRDSDLVEFEMADGALEGSIFRMLRQGQHVHEVIRLENLLKDLLEDGPPTLLGRRRDPTPNHLQYIFILGRLLLPRYSHTGVWSQHAN